MSLAFSNIRLTGRGHPKHCSSNRSSRFTELKNYGEHYPRGCSNWDPIEHRLFSQISLNRDWTTFLNITLSALNGTIQFARVLQTLRGYLMASTNREVNFSCVLNQFSLWSMGQFGKLSHIYSSIAPDNPDTPMKSDLRLQSARKPCMKIAIHYRVFRF